MEIVAPALYRPATYQRARMAIARRDRYHAAAQSAHIHRRQPIRRRPPNRR